MEIVRYGDDPSQYAELHLRDRTSSGAAVVALLHGGFWRTAYDLDLMHPLAADLTERGYAAWNIEYRRVGQPGGGWPGTFRDVAMALDVLRDTAGTYGLDTGRVAVVGHSAGGHLALWLAARHRLPGPPTTPPRTAPTTPPGASPRVQPRAVVSLAGVADLRAADDDGLGEDATAGLLGGHAAEVADRYGLASPRELLPFGVPQLLIHGEADGRVPVSQSRSYAAAARSAGDPVELVEFPGVGHFEVIEPAHESWTTVVDRLRRLL